MKNSFLILLILLFTVTTQANAQAVRNVVERGQNRNQIAKTKAEIQRDRQEIADFRATRTALGAAISKGNAANAQVKHA